MAKFNKDSVGGTVLVVLLLSLVCSIIVAGSAVALKPTQEEQKLLDKQKNILSVAGLLDKGSVKDVFSKFIDTKYVDLDSGDYVDSANNAEEAIAPEADKAGIRKRTKTAEIYMVKNEQGSVEQIVLPIYGTGLWSVMYGFVSVEPDGNTIKGINFYQHGETPGLGGEIENPNWQKVFQGKKLYSDNHQPAIKVVKGQAPQDAHSVDGLSGATLTGNGVQGTFDYWFSDNAYGKYLSKLKAGAN
ncbi:Na(+)-translocating NADH-quinone reductase subunit C [Pasteurellaceae bacterium RH1A]|nr:Na(+)-translocating NADH-quinone reductase subunit C [Pasteurellaceae bacterium RH1A]